MNPLLYGLEKEGKLERRSSPSKPSRKEWKLAVVQLSKDDGDSAPEDLNRFISSQEEMKLERTSSTSTPSRDRTDEILEYLEPRDWTDTLAISKAVVGNSGTQSDVNPLLYGLEKRASLRGGRRQANQAAKNGSLRWCSLARMTETARRRT